MTLLFTALALIAFAANSLMCRLALGGGSIQPRSPRSGWSPDLPASGTFQITERLLARNITEANNFTGTMPLNFLGIYRVNAGTVFNVGYDDRYRNGDKFETLVYPDAAYRRTNRAIFTKLQDLFRY